jgi:hypothetical protein
MYILPTLDVFCIYLRINGDLCHLHHKPIGFYNREEKCLLRGTNWVFKWSSLRFVFKELKDSACVHMDGDTRIYLQFSCGNLSKIRYFDKRLDNYIGLCVVCNGTVIRAV